MRRLSAEPGRPIGEALLDQRNLAGIGNVYRAEVLFLRGLSPWQPVAGVADLDAVAELARRLLEANKERHGHITTGSMRRGEEHWVYGRRAGHAAAAARRSGRRDSRTGSSIGARPANRRPIRPANGEGAGWRTGGQDDSLARSPHGTNGPACYLIVTPNHAPPGTT